MFANGISATTWEENLEKGAANDPKRASGWIPDCRLDKDFTTSQKTL
jgi:hypothetical protein